jgi:hypothetical protein
MKWILILCENRVCAHAKNMKEWHGKHLFEVVRPHNTKASAALEPLPCSLSSVVPDPEPCSRLTQWKSPHWLERYYDQQRSRPLLATSLIVVIPSLHAYRVHRNTRCSGIVTSSKWACFPFCARGEMDVGIALIIPNTHHNDTASSWTSMTHLFSAPLDFMCMQLRVLHQEINTE